MSEDQSATISFLASPAAFGTREPAEVIETHGAFVFLSGTQALKLKRAVTYDYMDLGTPDMRRDMLCRELTLNRPVAPEIYRDVVPVTRDGGTLMLDGPGIPVDWVLRMHRFPAENELTAIAARGDLSDALARDMGIALARYHQAAPVRATNGADLIAAILDELDRVFAEFQHIAAAQDHGAWAASARAELARMHDLLNRRAAAGHVRRGHGDLHLRNLVVIDGRPVPFDALEFDETLGTCDVLYDLAFLLMDLCHRHLNRAACRVLDAWLTASMGAEDEGLAALPLFLSVRAAIRAMVLLQTDAARGQGGSSSEEIAQYMRQARRFLSVAPPVLIAIGGHSGSGKSVLARSLAPDLGGAPGAILLSSDEQRKAGRAASAALANEAYRQVARAQVYDRIFARAAKILKAGHCVVLDATFLDSLTRNRAEAVARDAQVPFVGFWLTAPEAILERRVAKRSGDISDADLSVLKGQLSRDVGVMAWTVLDAAQSVVAIENAAWRVLADHEGFSRQRAHPQSANP